MPKNPDKDKKDGEACSTCAFFYLTSTSDPYASKICKRYPRAVPKIEADWCGEWQQA